MSNHHRKPDEIQRQAGLNIIMIEIKIKIKKENPEVTSGDRGLLNHLLDMNNVDLISRAHDGVHRPPEGILTPLGSIHREQEVTAHVAEGEVLNGKGGTKG